MTWRYIIKQLAFPPSSLLLLLLCAFLLRKRWPKLALASFVISSSGLYIMSLPITVEYAARALETEAPLLLEQWSTLAQ
ncbi:MAG: YdcF family protein, partial [Pseudomonas sp.]|nr:YdcF family protein [Pseudomonas sp.]